MPDFSNEGMQKWREVLPLDLRECMTDEGSEGSGVLINALKTVHPEDVASLLPLHEEDVVFFGRARRLRLMAWTLNQSMDGGTTSMRILSDLIGEDDEGNGGKRGEVSNILYHDYLAFVTTLGPRAARGIINIDSIENVMGAAFSAKDDILNRMGGVI